ncbi:4-hydroxyphenylacetate 3-hydroxylase family protein [Desulfosporosinus lacus]|uniref:4-hydroxybutyryl-CoA dehydratase / vinylacetyl-CoA-Delta-isomerase n=1 Tax=Desulfosporosinus lacus DSM 15449 TaxID=1121420 RepID=A0A1M5YCS2_9FIRM|nr:4-hydroxyphenylacetate 3-hydroxylase N-terminal domain-containing protein [Desulfosporosinus lacus]SHI09323.1 4-hydroxybutyryl-CoA dehydratase / vinylacetyl-CoA-Delta-isomerase [Desulfosporosinus lacus DSM 15449]
MRTAEQYIAKLKTMRPNIYLNGEVVSRDDSRLKYGVNTISETFNWAMDPANEELLTAKSHLTGEKINRYCHIHQSPEDLLKKQEMTRFFCQKVGGCIQRCMGIDALNALSVVTKNIDLEMGTEYNERFLNYLKKYQEEDLVANCAQTDVKGDRSLRPHQQTDPDLYLRVVGKTDEGIIVRGCKAHNTIAPYADEIIVVPTRMMTEKDADWAVAFAIQADAPGVSQVVRVSNPRPREELQAPFNNYGSADSLTVFDDVLVPWERVFMCGEYKFAGQLASLFATYHRHSYTGCKPATTDVLMGATALVAEYNGVEKSSQVREELAELVTMAELVFAAGIAASVKSTKAPSGTQIPDIVYTNVGRYHAGINVYREHEILAEIAGGLPATLPSEKEFFNPVISDFMAKYIMRKDGITAEAQHRCFRMISDLLCSSHAGVVQVAGVHGGGSPIMERIAITGQYDMKSKKNLAKYLAGIRD